MTSWQFICFSTDAWDQVWRRRQHLMSRFAAREEVDSVYFVNPPAPIARSGPGAMRTSVREERPNLFVIQTWSPAPLQRFSVMRRFSRAALASRLGRMIPKSPGAKRVLWLYIPFDNAYMGKMGEAFSVAELTDDWTKYSANDAWIEALETETAAMIRGAALTAAVSPALADKWMGVGPRPIELVPNGTDFEHFYRTAALREKSGRPRAPEAAYVGTLDDKIDAALLDDLLQRRPGVRFKLIGPISNGAVSALQARRPNLELTGPVDYARLPEALASADVLLIPHLVNALTESLHPIKLYEYLATGLPVVSTPVSGVREHSAIVSLASGAEAFASAMDRAIEEADLGRDERLAVARANDWNERAERLLKLLNGLT